MYVPNLTIFLCLGGEEVVDNRSWVKIISAEICTEIQFHTWQQETINSRGNQELHMTTAARRRCLSNSGLFNIIYYNHVFRQRTFSNF